MLPFVEPPEIEVVIVEDELFTLMSYDFESLLTRLTADAAVDDAKRAAAIISENFIFFLRCG